MIVSCFYSFKQAWIIDSKIIDQSLHIHNIQSFKNQPVQTIGNILKNKTYPIYINKHEPLKIIVQHANQFDILDENSDESQALEDVWLDLKSNDRLIIDKDFNLPENNQELTNCLKILVKASLNKLFRSPTKIILGGTVRSRGNKKKFYSVRF